jgi:hypothetical protein
MARRRLALVLVVEAAMLALLLSVAFDQYVHAHAQMQDGVNAWGYRGPVARRRAYDETRIVMAGGTGAFQPGVALRDTVTERIRFRVEEWVTFDRGPVTAFNLGVVNLPRGGYADRLERYRYLKPDVICVYAELVPVTAPPPDGGLLEKLSGYVVVAPGLSAVDRALGRLVSNPAPPDELAAIGEAVRAGLTMAPVVVIVPPGDSHEHRALRAVLERFRGEARLKIVTLTESSPAGDQIAPAVSEFLRARKGPVPGE